MRKNVKIIFISIFFLFFCLSEVKASSLSEKLKGRILLQVEKSGEAWYINPGDGRRLYLGRPDDAYNVMRKLGVGIKNSDLSKIPIGVGAVSGTDTDNDGLSDIFEDVIKTDKTKKDTDSDGYSDRDEVAGGFNPLNNSLTSLINDDDFVKKNLGKIFLQIENKGEAWYVNPEDAKRYFLGRPGDAYNVMRKLGLGIKNKDIETILEDEISPKAVEGKISVKAVKNKISPEEAKVKIIEFVNNYLVQPGNQVTVDSVVEENGVYKATVNISSQQQKVDSYLSLDGKIFFPQAMNITEYAKKIGVQNREQKTEVNLEDVKKKDKPEVELFVMSHCPYGVQMEKGIIPVIEALGDKVEFDLKFCDYAMHGEKELKEQMSQHCIQKKMPNKLLPYLKCFLVDGDSENCVSKTGIDKNVLEDCVSEIDVQYKVTENFTNKETWKSGHYPLFDVYQEDNTKYGIGGSPSLVLNGQIISASRDSASLLKTICAGFNEKPVECDTSLSSEVPGVGFGVGASGAVIEDANCGS